jgi:hypothetical protein
MKHQQVMPIQLNRLYVMAKKWVAMISARVVLVRSSSNVTASLPNF